MYALVYGGIQRFKFYDDGTIKSAFFNVTFTFDCNTWGINSDDGQIDITKTKYEQLIKYMYDNSGLIKVINTNTYGDGILIRKDLNTRGGWNTIELLFLTCNYSKTSSGFLDQITKKGWL